ncbi:MAG: response regulator [Proteobacteria bacterium]|nr:MAG: response regulator [Pseudomonadota bacterium]
MTGPTEVNKTALVAEDDPIFRKLVVRGLIRFGYTVIEAENGRIAMDLFDKTKSQITLVVSDIRMPDADGVALLAHVRLNSNIPFIVMTGYSEVVDKSDIFALGATDLLSKPFNFDKLIESVDRCLKKNADQLSA